MASTEFLGEGASLVRPPAFNGSAYMYWKERKLIFLEASGLDILDAVENGPYVPKLAGNDGSLIKKPRSDWVSNCKTAKEMWDTLQETHEGTTNVKRARTNTLMHEYELFNMKKDESINDLQTRFKHVINNLNALGKVTAIVESKDLGCMTIATLFGKIREHEIELHRLNESEQTDRKRKGLSLKAEAHKVKSEPETCTDDSESETDEEPEIGMLVRKFKKFLKKKGIQPKKPSNSRTKSFSKNESNVSKVITCYECGKSDHINSECFQLQNRNKKVESLQFDLAKFTNGRNNLNVLLGNQKNANEKSGIGYRPNRNAQKNHKFVGSKPIHDVFIKPTQRSESTTVFKDVLYVKGLKHNLLSISQLCDKGYQVYFTSHTCTLEHKEDDSIKLVGERVNNIYMIDLDSLPANNVCCLLSNLMKIGCGTRE
ncbi:uncharacterized protein [Cicer arietinum]|uniref:uncharacterized protein n=1 Tax=Cicer arietinum TaxID=3827 RepID=UPI003CC6D5EF